MNIIKRDGIIESSDSTKISDAIKKSTNGKKGYDHYKLTCLGIDCLYEIEEKYGAQSTVEVDVIHNEVISYLKKHHLYELAINYSEYRDDRTKCRMKNSELMKTVKMLGKESNKSNANVGSNFSAKLLMIASESNKCNVLGEMPKEISRLHEVGDIYYHDLDSYNLTTNCLHIPAAKKLETGFNTGYGFINPPKRIDSAADLICILIQSVQNNI